MKTEPTVSHPTLELRSFPCEVRMGSNPAGQKMVTGYGAVFNSRSQVLYTEKGDPFVEIVKPGAFVKSLADADVRALMNHDTRFLLGRLNARTLRLKEDEKGLPYEIDLGNRSYDRDLEESLVRGDIYGSSFSFATVEDDWQEGPNGIAQRELRSVHLFDVGPVVFPAYLASSATFRSFERFAETRSARGASSPGVTYPTAEQTALLNWLSLA